MISFLADRAGRWLADGYDITVVRSAFVTITDELLVLMVGAVFGEDDRDEQEVRQAESTSAPAVQEHRGEDASENDVPTPDQEEEVRPQ